MSSIQLKIANILLEIGCVKFNPSRPFTYASGLKGPIYCDNRLLLSYPKQRELVVSAFLELIKDKGIKFDSLAGIATAGIPHAAFLAQSLSLPMQYIRSKAKEHGRRNQVEGDFKPGQKALLVEDLINQGSSLREAVLGARESGLVVTDCLCIVDYQMETSKLVANELGLELHTLTNFESLMQAALINGDLKQDQIDLLRSWQRDPKNWSASA